jgi:hypothetical protein
VAHIIQCDIKLCRPEERDGCKGETLTGHIVPSHSTPLQSRSPVLDPGVLAGA